MENIPLILMSLLGAALGLGIAHAMKRTVIVLLGKGLVSTLISYSLILIGIIFLLRNEQVRNSELATTYKLKVLNLSQEKV